MPDGKSSGLAAIVDKHQKTILTEWIDQQIADGGLRSGQLSEAEMREQSTRFFQAFRDALQSGHADDVTGAAWAETREILEEVSHGRALQGFTPSETAIFVFSLKQPIFGCLRKELAKNAEGLADETWALSVLLDRLGLYTTEAYQKSREDVIARQQQELMELSTPVVELWEGVLALPLIGTLDSARTQVVMENLLQQIVDSEAEIAIIDITGVPTVDTLVAQHLIKTVSAARLMGADCIISGIRPQIAQTIVHLGLELDVVSKATMADAFALALRRTGRTVVRRQSDGGATERDRNGLRAAPQD
jgi:rsbT co-antagonist protein RsbR